MSTQLDGWEQQLKTNYRARQMVRRRTRWPLTLWEPFRGRTRDRPPEPLAIIKANARHLEGPPSTDPNDLSLRPNPKALRHLAYYCCERSKLLDGFEAGRYADALLALSAHWHDWVRPLDSWQPPPQEASVQFGSLARHLLARYEVPTFLDAAWRAGLIPEGLRQQDWFKHIGRGENIRTAIGLPVPLTRRMAHHFLQAPSEFDIRAAFRYGQVLGLGGDERLVRSLLGTRLATHFEANDFWETVIRWLIDHPEIEPVHHGPVIDYLYYQKFVPSLPSGFARGHPRLMPARPNLHMKGRTPASLLRAVEQWHRQLGKQHGSFASWKPSGIPAFTIAETGQGGQKIYAMTELISSAELEEEGAAMSHCVATYAALCESGMSSIWSLTVEDASGMTNRLLTLEVRTWTLEVVQARGKFNRPAEPVELRILTQWTRAGGPSLSPLVFQ